jgi:hypothetical protein
MLGGCFSTGIRDVTDDPQFVGLYRRGQLLTAITPLFIAKTPSIADARMLYPANDTVCGKGLSFFQVPATEAEYRANPSKYPKIMGIVNLGTTLQFLKGEYMFGPDQRLFLTGMIAEGEFKGLEVSLDAVSDYPTRNRGTVKPACLTPKL